MLTPDQVTRRLHKMSPGVDITTSWSPEAIGAMVIKMPARTASYGDEPYISRYLRMAVGVPVQIVDVQKMRADVRRGGRYLVTVFFDG